MANISHWFNWGALEAIGTVGALWFAVLQSSRAARAERARQIGTLTALIGLVEPVTEAVPIFEEHDDGRLTPSEISYLLHAKPIIQRAIDGIPRLSLADAAAVGVTEYVGALPMALSALKDYLPSNDSAVIFSEDINMMSAYPSEACEFFSSQRDFIEHGRIGSYLRAAARRVENRYWRWRSKTPSRRLLEESLVPATDPSISPPEPPHSGG